ncbi:13512_t:CDS:2 [Cetraspora pellucida]|uniref:13512_t:CDS:1 n=1 Tax=Cetraspora pellucida TaxID=1433469 RepID=A0A9N9E0P3_9GLOM|nr:13512_t:CDS:2 [Cetraspora pellucida]
MGRDKVRKLDQSKLLQFSSILLLGVLVFALLTSTPQFAHATLLQLFISALIFDSIGLIPIIILGDDLSTLGAHSLLCIDAYCPLHRLAEDATTDSFGTMVSLYMCIPVFDNRTFYGYVLPNTVITVLSIPMSCHTGFILWKRWRTFSSHQNRSTAIRLGHSVRLFVFSSTIIIFLLATLIPRFIIYNQSKPTTQYILAFSTALLGVLLFLIFGTNRRAAVFLPCCYYTPPTLPLQTMQGLSSNSNASARENYVLQTLNPVTVNLPENISQTDTIKSKKKTYLSRLPNIFGNG